MSKELKFRQLMKLTKNQSITGYWVRHGGRLWKLRVQQSQWLHQYLAYSVLNVKDLDGLNMTGHLDQDDFKQGRFFRNYWDAFAEQCRQRQNVGTKDNDERTEI